MKEEKNTPGPGSYELISEFGAYNAGNFGPRASSFTSD